MSRINTPNAKRKKKAIQDLQKKMVIILSHINITVQLLAIKFFMIIGQ